ncbi:helix-turn-helix domain-containing protein [Enterococcus faecalis]|uniref:helix-turn-helix domain-containing protein n=1 Tax=Enterococcus faecalis TaxID=1351 RepID=UPI003D76BFB0
MSKEGYFEFVSEDILLEIKLAEYLDRNPIYIGTEEICTNFGISMFTARKIVRTLELDINDYNTEGYLIDVSPKGVRLQVPMEDDLKVFFIYLMSKSPNIHVLKSIFSGKFKTVTQYALDNHLSEATVRRSLANVRGILQKLDIEIANRTFKLKGNEKQIRMTLFVFYWRINRGMVWPFESVSEKSMEFLVDRLCKSSNIKNVSLLQRKRLMFFFAITVIRMNSGNYIDMENIPKSTANLDELRKILASSGIINVVNKSELFFVYSMLKGFSLFTDMDDELFFEIENGYPAGVATEYSLEKLSEEFPVFFKTNEKKVTEFLYATHTFANELHNFSTDMNGYIYFRVLDEYFPEMSEWLVSYFQQAKTDTGISLFDEGPFLLTHYGMLLSHLPNSLSKERCINVYLETALPSVLNEMIIKQVDGYFKTRFNLRILIETDKLNKDDIDILLTTIPLKEFDLMYPNAHIIAINRELKLIDYEKIETVLLEVMSK